MLMAGDDGLRKQRTEMVIVAFSHSVQMWKKVLQDNTRQSSFLNNHQHFGDNDGRHINTCPACISF